jgi:hypothetical protein
LCMPTTEVCHADQKSPLGYMHGAVAAPEQGRVLTGLRCGLRLVAWPASVVVWCLVSNMLQALLHTYH